MNLPPHPALEIQHVHLWVVGTAFSTALEDRASRFSEEIGGLAPLLSSDERERAGRYHFEIDRQRFIARHGLLRLLLGAYLDSSPENVKLVTNSFGKPSIDAAALPLTNLLAHRLRFNLSHSASMVLFVFALDQDMGVDIEYVRQDFDFLPIARRFFSPVEQQALLSLFPEQLPQAFFNCWTRKEAYIKAHGLGLSLPLDQFDVSLKPDEPAQLLAARHAAASPPAEWMIFHLEPAPGYVGALAVQGQGWHLQIFDLKST